ncbi:MAG: 50S ribosomal protein L29 [Candidatus Saccharimonadales bacterium]
MADAKKTKLIEELRKLDEKALTSKIAELKSKLVEQQRALAAQELPNPKALSGTRKQIAQAHTLLTEVRAKAAQKEEK